MSYEFLLGRLQIESGDELLSQQVKSFVKDPSTLTRVDWSMWTNRPLVTLKQAVALSISLDSQYLRSSFYPFISRHLNEDDPNLKLFETYNHRSITIDHNTTDRGGELELFNEDEIKIELFVKFAIKKDWDIPDQLMSILTPRGTVLRLPWRNEKLEKLITALEPFFEENKTNPNIITSADIGRIIDKTFDYTPSPDGSPSRNSDTIAAFITPITDRTSGLKKRK